MIRGLCRDYGYTVHEARSIDIRDVYGVLYQKNLIQGDSKFVAQFIQLNRGKWIRGEDGVWFQPPESWLREKAKNLEWERRAKGNNDVNKTVSVL